MRHAAFGPLLREVRKLAAPEVSDAQLLDRFAAHRDEAAFAALVRRHGPLVLSVCRRVLRHAHDAEDAFQVTFLVLARKAGGLRRDGLSNWLYGVAYRSALEIKRQAARRRRREQQAAPRRPPDRELDLRELQAILDEELQRLPEKYRAPFVLCCLEGKSKPEAAAELGWKEGTVGSRLAAARQRLQARLRRRGVTLAGALAAVALAGDASPISASLLKNTTAVALRRLIRRNVLAALPRVLRSLAWTQAQRAAVLLAACSLLLGAGAWWHSVGNVTPGQPADAPAGDVRADRFGDPLPPRALARLGTTRFRHDFRVRQMMFAPDGEVLLTAGLGPQPFRRWELATGKELPRWTVDGVNVTASAVSPDGKVLVAHRQFPPDKRGLVFLDMATGKEVSLVDGQSQAFQGPAFSPDGKLLAAAGRDNVFRLWDLRTGKELRQLKEHKGRIHFLRFSPDGVTVGAAYTDNTIRLWDRATGNELGRLHGHEDRIRLLAFSADGARLLSLSGDDTWEVSKKNDRGLRLWDVAARREVRRIGRPGDKIIWAALSPDGQRAVTSSLDQVVILWDATTGKELRRWHGARGGAVAFSPDGKLLAINTTLDCAPLVWDLATDRELTQLAGHRSAVAELAFSPDGRSITSIDSNGQVLLWDVASGRERQLFRARVFSRVALSHDGATAATWHRGDDGCVQLWDLASGARVRLLGAHAWDSGRAERPVRPTAFSPDDRQLAAADSTDVILWDVDTGRKTRTFKGLADPVYCVAISSDGRVVAAAAYEADSPVLLWDNRTGQLLHSLRGGAGITDLAFSPDGRRIAVPFLSDHKVRLWDVASGKELRVFAGTAGYGVAFSADGRLVASMEDWEQGVVHVWETLTGEPVCHFPHAAPSLAFSPNGRTLATGGGDSSILLWDLTGRQQAGRLVPSRLVAPDLDRLWNRLGGPPAEAFQAAWTLVAAADQAVSLLRDRLRPVAAVEPEHLRRLLADLDSSRFAVRDQATRELEALNELAEPALRQMLNGNVSLELRRRTERLLDRLVARVPAAEELRGLRGVHVLEQVATPAARQLLQALAAGAPEARLTQDAQAALARLAARRE